MKIFDCFTFYNEFDILKVRLNELYETVDYFVLVEADRTFQGNPKPLYFNENKEQFKAFEKKIIHVICRFPEEVHNKFSRKFDQNWAREYFQRDQIGLGLTGAQGNDLVIVSDVDEIISRNKLIDAIEQRRPSELTVFEMPIYRFYVNRRSLDRNWLLGPRMIEYAKFSFAQKLRMTKPFASKTLGASLLGRLHTKVWNYLNCGIWADVRIVENSGWHFTSIGDWKQWRSKVDAYSHAERKELPTYKSEEAFQRFIEEKTQAADLGELPKMIQEQRQDFQFFE